MPQARACCVSKMFLLFSADLLLSVVHALLLPCLGPSGEGAGSSTAPLQSEKLHFKFSSFRGLLLVLAVLLCKKTLTILTISLTIPVYLQLFLTPTITSCIKTELVLQLCNIWSLICRFLLHPTV